MSSIFVHYQILALEFGGKEYYFIALKGAFAFLTTIIADACSLFRLIRLFLNKESSYNMLFSNKQS